MLRVGLLEMCAVLAGIRIVLTERISPVRVGYKMISLPKLTGVGRDCCTDSQKVKIKISFFPQKLNEKAEVCTLRNPDKSRASEGLTICPLCEA